MDCVGLPRPAYVGAIDGSFRRGDETWRETFRNAPPRWSLVSGDGSDERSAALSITGPDTGAIKTGDSAVYDFDMTFKVQFVDQPARASWKLRLQPNSSDGYKFDLVEESDGIHLRGYLVKAARVISLENGEQRIGLPSCCNPSDWYRISIKARNFDFMYSITVEPDSGDYLDLRSYLGIEFVTKIMRDSEKQFRWGDIGIGTDSTFKLSYFRLESKVGEK